MPWPAVLAGVLHACGDAAHDEHQTLPECSCTSAPLKRAAGLHPVLITHTSTRHSYDFVPPPSNHQPSNHQPSNHQLLLLAGYTPAAALFAERGSAPAATAPAAAGTALPPAAAPLAAFATTLPASSTLCLQHHAAALLQLLSMLLLSKHTHVGQMLMLLACSSRPSKLLLSWTAAATHTKLLKAAYYLHSSSTRKEAIACQQLCLTDHTYHTYHTYNSAENTHTTGPWGRQAPLLLEDCCMTAAYGALDDYAMPQQLAHSSTKLENLHPTQPHHHRGCVACTILYCCCALLSAVSMPCPVQSCAAISVTPAPQLPAVDLNSQQQAAVPPSYVQHTCWACRTLLNPTQPFLYPHYAVACCPALP
jgi:hypothetical protein